MKLKLNVLLGKTDHLSSIFNAMLKDYIQYFKKHEGAFYGEKKTYSPKPDTVDDPSKRSNIKIVTTVNEKLNWMRENSKDYVDALFSVEATNASGKAKAELKVDGKSWGEFSSLELLRLKSFLENNDLKGMIENIPVRADHENWTLTDSEEYTNRSVYQTEMVRNLEKTSDIENYILDDPNIGKLKDQSSYTPQIAQKRTVKELGDSTRQVFTGAISFRERAEILRKRGVLVTAVVEALKVCNEIEVVESKLTANKVFDYLFNEHE